MTNTKITAGKILLTIAFFLCLLLALASWWLWELMSYPVVVFAGLAALFLKLGGGPQFLRDFFRWAFTKQQSLPPNDWARGRVLKAFAGTIALGWLIGTIGYPVFVATVGHEQGYTVSVGPIGMLRLGIPGFILGFALPLVIALFMFIIGRDKTKDNGYEFNRPNDLPVDFKLAINMVIAAVTFALAWILPAYYSFAIAAGNTEPLMQAIVEFLALAWAILALHQWWKWGSGDHRWRWVPWLTVPFPLINGVMGVAMPFVVATLN